MRGVLQLVLDLFDAPGEPAHRPAATPRTQTHGPFQPAQPLPSVLTPAQFAHPRANRQTRLGHALVAYEFKRGKRRTIGMSISPEGLVVSAPRWVALGDVDAALQEKARWIVRKLGEMRERKERLEAARIEWRDGVVLPYLGQPLQVVLAPGSAPGGVQAGEQLHIGLPQQATPEQLRDAVQAWLMRQARPLFTERLHHYAPQLGVQWHKLSLSNAGTRWGSARSDGHIRLNWRLIHFRLDVIDYVVAHELSHLRVMDHSPRFWDTVRSVVPGYQALREQLRDESVPQWS